MSTVQTEPEQKAALVHAPISPIERSRYRPADLDECLGKLQAYFDNFAQVRDQWRKKTDGYHNEVERLYRYYIPKGASVLDIGCSTGDLLAAVEPSRGVGIDLSPAMIGCARKKYPHLQFEVMAAEKLSLGEEKFDYIVLSDLLSFSFDIRALFVALKPYCHARTRLIMNTYSRLWQPFISLCESLGLKYRQPVLNWVTTEDVANFLRLAGFETIQTDSRLLCPPRIPFLGRFLNSVVAPFRPFRWFSLTNWVVARLPLKPDGVEAAGQAPSVTVVCPCRNEEGNIPNIVKRLPRMGSRMELIFVEGNSKDGTYDACRQAKADNPQLDISVYKQSGKGKKDAVWLGFEKARGDVLMILDADLSVPPEDLPAFYDAIASGNVEFVNGSRLVYPMEGKAMRFLNLLGNKFFSLAFSYLIGQHVKDTLCGTKVLLRKDYQRLAENRAYFGDFDPFGDFDLLFGAAKLGLKITDLPIRYRERNYGETQISRFKHGWMLLKMCGVGLLRLKMR